MAVIRSLLALAHAACTLTPAAGNAFLRATSADKQLVAARAVEETLLTELAMLGRDRHLQDLQDELQPMFVALPKNAEGKLDAAAVRYGLHRFFVQSRGWFVQGLQPSGDAWSSTSPAELVKDRVPTFIQNLLERRVHGHGLSLQELAAFAATIQDLVHAEAVQNLVDGFAVLDLPLEGKLSEAQLTDAVEMYLMGFLLSANMSLFDVSALPLLRSDIVEVYPAWPDVRMWATDLLQTHLGKQRREARPFADNTSNFEDAADLVQQLGHGFGAFQDQECRSMKNLLVDMEYRGTGRVRLSDFYRGSLDGNWQFAESVDYLRAMGALDESDPRMPTVIIANYVGSQSNCVASSSFYSVCCMDECEGLTGQLERSIGEPTAAPDRLAELVASLPSETVDAPRTLPSALRKRLDEIAHHHGGQVPLHGRLFAQFMHHAYPRECPFPHTSGTTNPMTPDEWMSTYGEPEASVEEINRHISAGQSLNQSHAATFEDVHELLPWTSFEQLVIDQESAHFSRHGSQLGLLAKFVVLVTFGVMVFPALRGGLHKGAASESKLPRYMV